MCIALTLGHGCATGPPRAANAPGAPTPVENRSPSLVTTERLAAMLEGDAATLIDVRARWVDYLEGHLPGAVWLNTETLRATEGGIPFQLLSSRDYARLFARLGVRPQRSVVVYSAGDALDIDATFVAWLLAAFRQSPVYVLDGGYSKWRSENRRLTQRYARYAVANLRAEAFVLERASLEDVLGAQRRHGTLLIDARSPEQFGGQAGAQLRRGHIPGAVNHPWKDDLEVRDRATVWKPLDALRTSYAGHGITPDKDIITYCNSGTEASHVFFALRYLLGFPRVRVYVGSWTEWAERVELPVETGVGVGGPQDKEAP